MKPGSITSFLCKPSGVSCDHSQRRAVKKRQIEMAEGVFAGEYVPQGENVIKRENVIERVVHEAENLAVSVMKSCS